MLKDLICIDATLYFEISDADTFGGKGSIGYTSIKHGNLKNIDGITDEAIQANMNYVAKLMEVSPKKIRLISKAKYEANTDDEEAEE